MKCNSCRAPLPEGARFCAQCATPVPAQTAEDDPIREALTKALGTHYRVLRLLGRGGMGAVYLAHEDGLDRDVAIKVLPPERAHSPELRERFRREARTAARLTHPNVVPLHTFGEARGMMYYVMGYVHGESLAARLAREGRLPEPETRRLLTEIAGALDYAHRQGVVHRDIKPDNILLEESSGRPLLADFGIAKAVAGGESLTSTGSIIGTPSYMSPEQASGRGDVDARSDLYSLGVMAYAMLSGRLPFEGKTPADVIVQHMIRPAAPLSPLAPGTSATLAAAVMRCLEKDPELRWARASELAAAFRPQAEDPDSLPSELEQIESRGLSIALFYTYGLLVSAYGFYFSTRVPLNLGVRPFAFGPLPLFLVALLSLITFVLVVGRASAIGRARRQGFSWKEIVRVAFRQPFAWRLWYPRPLRRPSNVWDRLPSTATIVRSVWTGSLVLAALALPAFLWATAYWLDFPRAAQNVETVRSLGLAAVLSAALAAVGTSIWAKRALRSAALQRSLLVENFLLRAPLSAVSFWTRPEVAALLLAPPRRIHTETASGADPSRTTDNSTEAPTLQR